MEILGCAGSGPTFMIEYKANQMEVGTLKPKEVWYVDSSASKHMENHEEWFFNFEKPKHLGVFEPGDDTVHPIEHIGDVPLSHVGQRGIM